MTTQAQLDAAALAALTERVAALEAELDTNGKPGSWAWNILQHEVRLQRLEAPATREQRKADGDRAMLNALCSLAATTGEDHALFRTAAAAGLTAWALGKNGVAAMAAIVSFAQEGGTP